MNSDIMQKKDSKDISGSDLPPRKSPTGFWDDLPIGGKWDSNLHQYKMIFIVNMATFLQGASVGTSAISLPRMPSNASEPTNDVTWPADFVVTENDAYWISKCIGLQYVSKIRYFHLVISLSDYSWLISFIASGLVSNSVAEILGRKKSLMIDCLAFLIGYALYSVGENAATLCVARAFLGYPLINMVFNVNCYIQ